MASAIVRCTLRIPESKVSIERVYSLFLDEGISSPSRAVVRFPDYESRIKSEQVVGKSAVVILTQGNTETKFEGLLGSLALESGREGRTVYVAEIIDRFAACTSYRTFRVFERRDLKSIVAAVLGKSKILLDFKAASPVYPICVQFGESDFAFVSRLLEKNGLFSRMEGNVLRVCEDSTEGAGERVHCSYLETLQSFQLREGVAALEKRGLSHVHETEAWPEHDAPLGNAPGAGYAASAQLYAGKVDTEITEEVDDDALSRFTDVRAEAAAASTCVGVGRSTLPAIRPGVTASVMSAPRGEVNGDYFVWKVVHDFTMDDAASEQDTSYSNSFWCVPASVKYRPPRTHRAPRVYGVHVGTVVAPSSTRDEDSKGIGRVRVRLPWMGRDDLCQGISFWARVLEGHAGADHGTVFIPEKDDEVLVAFEGGSLDSPIVLGGLYTGNRRPPVPVSPGFKNEQKMILTRSGNAILFEDLAEGKSKLSLFQKGNKNRLQMNLDRKISIEISSEGSIRLCGSGGGEILLQQGNGSIRLDKDGNVEISGPKVTITGATGELVLKAPMIRIN